MIDARFTSAVAGALILLELASVRAQTNLSRRAPLQLRSATALETTVPRFGTFELTLDLSATYENPFDPEQIDVNAVFMPPSGKPIQVNGFLYQPFNRRLENDTEKLEPAGEPTWKMRFTPHVAGAWSYTITARDKSGAVSLPRAVFTVIESENRGFIRRSGSNPRVFAWDDGQPFFGVGENLCWGGKRGSFDYDQWLPELAKAGGNFIRVWMSSWNCALEWSAAERGDWRAGSYHGVGRYSLDNGWKLDRILDTAERNGISVMLCLGTYGEFNEGGYFGEGQWKANPYNQANGGACAKPADFWTAANARKLYQRRLRYLTARYGSRGNLHSWEFWNEAQAPAPWVAEMARALKGTGEFAGKPLDPYGHLVSTTYGNDEVWKIPEIDFTMTHSYGTGNIADHGVVVRDEARKHEKYGKPHLMAEFGIDWRSPDAKYDADGKAINLHNALWSSVVSGDGGSAMVWWWDNYIHPKGLFAQYSPVRRFARTVPWTEGGWRRLRAEATCLSDGTASQGASEASKSPAGKPAVFGLTNGRISVAWVHNPEHNWKTVYERKPVQVLKGVKLKLEDFASGPYRLEWWDTRTGEITGREELRAADQSLAVELKELADDIALRIESAASR